MSCLRILLLVPLFLCSGISGSLASSAGCSCGDRTHDFSSFSSGSADELVLIKDAEISNGVLHLTADDSRNRNRSGAALLPAPVILWCQDPEDVKQNASFKASFTMGIMERRGDGGLAFVLVPSLNSPPLDILGLGNNPSSKATSSSTSSGFVTFTFDTVKQSYDPDGNRSIISINAGVSVSDDVVARSSLNITVPTNLQAATKNFTVWIEYNNGAGRHDRAVSIYMNVQGQAKPDKAAIDVALNLSDHLPQRAFVGLLAWTDVSSELQSVLSWNLQVTLPGDGPSMDWRVILPAVLGGIAFTGIMNLFVAVFYFNSKYNKLKMELNTSFTLLLEAELMDFFVTITIHIKRFDDYLGMTKPNIENNMTRNSTKLLTDWVWRLHREGRLLEAVDKNVISTEGYDADGVTRLLILGLACTNPNPLDRPSMTEVMQVVAKSVPAPNVPLEKPTFVWPPEEGILHSSFDDITEMSDLHESHLEETSSSDALAASAIIRRKARAQSVELYCL
ncbi:unnamed protein product [Miscanthus lutarioriparius]|uniref:Legume lectin domain-containing protein n=1 Tax=Miscanthus lutarioriparius TaxID=422564 RepID=A0A811QYP7_9POAL|nr:unnamed protein product [Miscanthus lutarioriparius]